MIRSMSVWPVALLTSFLLGSPVSAQDADAGADDPAPAKKQAPRGELPRRVEADAPAEEGAEPAPAKGESNVEELTPASLSGIDALIGPPSNTEETWMAVDRAVNYGQVDRAKRYLDELLARPDMNAAKALELREKFGSSLLVKLQTHPDLREASKKLVDMANEAARAKARDAERIVHFLDNLSKSPGERGYAILQLRKSGTHAIPYFVSALRNSKDSPSDLMAGLLQMPPSSWPAVAALLDSDDERLMDMAIVALRAYAVPASANSLWYVSAEPKYSQTLRAHATETLHYLTGNTGGSLPSAVRALGDIADKYYRHQIRVSPTGDTAEVWFWDGNNVNVLTTSETGAEEYYANKAAKQALALDPTYRPAKITLLSVAFEKSYEKVGIDAPLPGVRDGVLEMALAAGPELLTEVLANSLRDHRTAVVLGAVRALGNVGNASLLADHNGRPGLLLQALNYPDHRVQFAAAVAALELHTGGKLSNSARIVHALLRALDPSVLPLALAVDGNHARANQLADLAQQLGYRAQVANSGRAGFAAAADLGTVELIMIDSRIQEWGAIETVSNIRADARTSGIPILVISTEENAFRLKSLEQRYDAVIVTPAIASKDHLASVLKVGFDDAMARPFSEGERTTNQRIAMDWISRLAHGEMTSLDVRQASNSLIALLDSAELGQQAAQTLGRLPSAQTQDALAAAVINESIPLGTRVAASHALSKSIQHAGQALDSATLLKMHAVLDKAEDPQLRVALARLIGASRPTDHHVTRQMLRYRPLTGAEKAVAPIAPGATAAPAADAAPAPTNAEKPAPAKPADEAPAEKKATKKRSFFDNE